MANEFIKLTAAALTMLSAEALDPAVASPIQHTEATVAGAPTGLLPEDLIVDFSGRIRVGISSENIDELTTTCNSPCTNAPPNCCCSGKSC